MFTKINTFRRVLRDLRVLIDFKLHQKNHVITGQKFETDYPNYAKATGAEHAIGRKLCHSRARVLVFDL